MSNPRAVDGFSNFIFGSFAVFLNNEFIDKLIPGIIHPPKYVESFITSNVVAVPKSIIISSLSGYFLLHSIISQNME